MGKIKTLTLRFDNIEDLEKMKSEYDFIGRETEINRQKLELVILTLPRNSRKKTAKESRNSQHREQNGYDENYR